MVVEKPVSSMNESPFEPFTLAGTIMRSREVLIGMVATRLAPKDVFAHDDSATSKTNDALIPCGFICSRHCPCNYCLRPRCRQSNECLWRWPDPRADGAPGSTKKVGGHCAVASRASD